MPCDPKHQMLPLASEMNPQPLRRSIAISVALTLIVALVAFVAAVAAAQSTEGGVTRVQAPQTLRLTLADAVRMAAKQSATVEGARSRVDAAQARVTQRKADLFPTLTATAREGGSTINSATFPIELPSAPGQPVLFPPDGKILGPVNALDVRARIQQSLFDPAARTRIASAKSVVDVANAEVANASDVAATMAANAYLLVLRADAVYSARIADSTLAAELLGIAQDQLTAGTGVALDVTRARSQLAGARAQLIGARNERDRTRVDLARALGLPPVRIELSDALGTLPSTVSFDETAALDTALRERKDVQSLELQARSSRLQASAIRDERFPTVGVFADEGQSQRNARSYLPTYDWGIQLSVPIFDGFRREGRVEEQVSGARELDIRARDLRAQVEADVRSAMLNLRSSGEIVTAARERLSFAEQEVSQSRERFQAGVSGNADLITASMTLNAARTQLVDALTSFQGARVALARAQGSIAAIQ